MLQLAIFFTISGLTPALVNDTIGRSLVRVLLFTKILYEWRTQMIWIPWYTMVKLNDHILTETSLQKISPLQKIASLKKVVSLQKIASLKKVVSLQKITSLKKVTSL